jgi:hypothetical protein
MISGARLDMSAGENCRKTGIGEISGHMGWSARKLLQSKKERNWSGGCLPAWRGLSSVNARDHWQDSPAIRSPSLVVVRGMQGAQNGSQTGPLGYGSAIPPTYQEPQSGTLSERLEG